MVRIECAERKKRKRDETMTAVFNFVVFEKEKCQRLVNSLM